MADQCPAVPCPVAACPAGTPQPASPLAADPRRLSRVLRRLLLAIVAGAAIAEALVAGLEWAARREHEAGAHAAALRLWKFAARAGAGPLRRAGLEGMVRCGGETGDGEAVADAAVVLAAAAHGRSFGEWDALVARRVAGTLPPDPPQPGEHDPDEAEGQSLGVRIRDGVGDLLHGHAPGYTVTLSRSAFRTLFTSTWAPRQDELPVGAPRKLARQLEEPKLNPWERGKTAYVLSLRLEKAGYLALARALCRRAYDLLRSAYPTYEGADWDGLPNYRGAACGLLCAVQAAARRMDPAVPDLHHGGLRLRVEGTEFPAPWRVSLQVSLWDTSLPDSVPDEDWYDYLGRSVGLAPDRTARVGVGEGTYRLRVGVRNAWAGEGVPLRELLELETSSLPKEVRIAGETLDLPPIRARLLEEIDALGPEEGQTVSRATGVLEWTPIAGAERYELSLANREDHENGCSYGDWQRATTREARLVLADCEHGAREVLDRAASMPGRRVAWCYIQAFDADGRAIGRQAHNVRCFVLAEAPR
ncbi:MAG: hypothetical protein HYZ53_29875 [Planctomycetes bacterium]|nr:hypothetical protein [Planctomycetota bacterium]